MQERGVPIARSFRGHNCHTARQKRRAGEDCARPGERPRKRVRGRRAEPSPSPRTSPPFPQLPYPHLHLSSTSASGRRPRPAPPNTKPALAWRSLSLATNRPPPATSPLSSEPIGARAPPLAPSPTTPGLRMAEPRRGGSIEDSQWKMRGGLRAGGGRGSRRGLQRRRDRGRRRPRADPSSAGPLARIYTSAGRVLAPRCVTWRPLEMPFSPCLPLSLL